jgi:integrase
MGRPVATAKVRLPRYVNAYIDPTGKPRHYFRRAGAKQMALPGLPWSADFMAAYARAMEDYRAPARAPIGSGGTLAGTVNSAVVAYYQSSAFAVELAKGTQGPQRSLIERFRSEHGDKRIRLLERKHLQAYISALTSAAVQRNMLRALRHFLKYAVTAGMIAEDPTNGVSRIKMKSTGGFYAWTEDDVAKFEAAHPVGSQARLALALYLNLGVRKSDVVRIGPRSIRNGELVDFAPQKTSHNNGKLITVPLLEETKAILAATPVTGTDAYLVNSWGKPYTAAGFGNKMREWCDAAGLPECTSHGLRKLCLIRLAEAGFSAPAIGSISGHKDLREIQTYIDAADRKKMARATIAAVEAARKANTGLPNAQSLLGNSAKKTNNIKGKN